jgi:hypothetical protein
MITSSEISIAFSFSIERMARSDSFDSVIRDLNLVLILFIVEKDLSLSVLVTAMVRAL